MFKIVTGTVGVECRRYRYGLSLRCRAFPPASRPPARATDFSESVEIAVGLRKHERGTVGVGLPRSWTYTAPSRFPWEPPPPEIAGERDDIAEETSRARVGLLTITGRQALRRQDRYRKLRPHPPTMIIVRCTNHHALARHLPRESRSSRTREGWGCSMIVGTSAYAAQIVPIGGAGLVAPVLSPAPRPPHGHRDRHPGAETSRSAGWDCSELAPGPRCRAAHVIDVGRAGVIRAGVVIRSPTTTRSRIPPTEYPKPSNGAGL